MDNCIAVLVHYNRPDQCADSVRSLLADDPSMTVLVVDNNSREADYSRLVGLHSSTVNCTVVRSPANIGFAGILASADRMAPWLTGEGVLLFAADDIEIAPGTIRHLASAVGEAGAAVAFAAREPLERGHWSAVRGSHYSRLPLTPDQAGEVVAGLFFPTPLVAVNRKLWSDGLRPDARLFCYGEECDLGLRARAMGLTTVLVPRAVVRNRELGGASTSDFVQYCKARNSVLLAAWHAGRSASLAAACWWLASGLRSAATPGSVNRALGRARIAGAWAAVSRRGSIAPVQERLSRPDRSTRG